MKFLKVISVLIVIIAVLNLVYFLQRDYQLINPAQLPEFLSFLNEIEQPQPEETAAEPAASQSENTAAEAPPATQTDDTPTTSTGAALAPESPPAGTPSTAAQILARGRLLAGVKYDFAPFGFLNEQEQVVGFDIDIAREFARRWLGDEQAIDLIQVTSGDRIARLAAGDVDLLLASMTHKRERDELIDFSQVYFLDGQSLLVRSDSGINNFSDLEGKLVAAIEGSTSIDNIEREANRRGIEIELQSFQQYPDAESALKAGQVDALTTDKTALLAMAQNSPELKLVGETFTSEPYGIGVPQGDTDFREFVNFTLQAMKADGTYDRIYQQWFADRSYPVEVLPGEQPFGTLADLAVSLEPVATSRVDMIRAGETLTAGVKEDFAPFGFLQDGERVGFDVDLIREFSRRWYNDENAIQLKTVTSKDRIPRLASNELDLVAASMTHKKDRDKDIDFSQVYFLDGQSLLVREADGLEQFADLEGKNVAALQGSTSIINIQQRADELGVGLNVIPYVGVPEAVAALTAGEVDAFTTDSIALSTLAAQNPELQVIGGLFTREPYGMGVPKNDYRFRELVNFTLQEMKRDGTYDTIYQRWFSDFQANATPYPVQVLPGDAGYLLVEAGQNIIETYRHSVISRIRDDNSLVAGVKFDFPPFGFLNENDQVVGFDVDLMQAMADLWGIEVEFVQVTSKNRIDKLVADEVDIVAASMTHKKDRDERIDFSQTYFLDGQGLLVREDSGINGIQDMDGKVVAAIQGSTSIDQIQAYAQLNNVSVEVIPFAEYLPAVDALVAGQIDVLTTDQVALSQFAQQHPELTIVGERFTEEPYGLGLPPGDSYFNNLVNFSLQILVEQGVYQRLYRKWFGDLPLYQPELLPGEWPYTLQDSPDSLDTPVRSKVFDILEDDRFVAGVKFDFKPFGYLDDNDALVGFDIDLMKEFAKRWLGDPNKIEFVRVTSDDRIPKLAAGEVDIVAASMTHKKDRDDLIDFSQTYFADVQDLLVKNSTNIETLADLDGKSVAAVAGSTSINNIAVVAERLGITIDVVPFQEYPQALSALLSDQLDVLTTDRLALTQFAKDNPGLKVVNIAISSEPYGMGLPNHDALFGDLINFTLQEIKIDGTYDRLYQKWFGDLPPYKIEIWPGDSYLSEIALTPMIRIPAGEFIRGRDQTSPAFVNESPQQSISLDEFYVDQYEVSNRLYDVCVKAARCPLPRLTRSVNFADYYVKSDFRNYPVVWVTWEDAQAYCEFVGKRLPTEAEWEKAARGTEGLIYPWGDETPSEQKVNAGYNAGSMMPVGSYEAGVSPYGVYDLAGNAREWVADWFDRGYYEVAPVENPTGPVSGTNKVIRGGAWNDNMRDITTTRRKEGLPNSTFDGGLGFRCVSSTFPPSR